MKPSERIQQIVHQNSGSFIGAILQYLDEQYERRIDIYKEFLAKVRTTDKKKKVKKPQQH